jgi:PKD repeat protein
MKRFTLLSALLLLLLALVFGLTIQPVPAAQTPVLDYDFVVVRAYFDDLEMVAQLAGDTEPWELNLQKQYIVLDVDAAEYYQLERAGFRLEIDEGQTAKLNAPRVPLANQGGGIPGFPCYRTVEETYATAAAIATNYPTLAEWIDVGDSWEKLTPGGLPGYDMMVLRLTNESITRPKPKLFITSAIHAREYTTAELNTRFAEYLINHYGSDPDVTWLLDHHEIHLMLQANPDGRKHAETGLLWRKNTNNNYCANTNSRGADLNRNFQFQWGCCGGSSSNPCSDTYRGASAASEPETQAVQNYVLANFPDLREPPIGAAAPLTTTGIYIDIHSYSQLVLWPWGFTSTPTGNNTELVTLGRKFAYFNGYTPQQAIDLYITDGTTDDFVYGEIGLPAYTFELGTDFFQACADFENTIYPDNLPALIYAAKAVREPYIAPAGPEALNVLALPGGVVAGTPVTLTATVNDTRFNNSNGTEPTQNIAAAEYYIDVPPWITETTPVALPMSPADGNFNSPVEGATAVIDTTGLTEGRHTIFVRGQDANGTWGVFTAAFLYIIDPAVAPVLAGEVTAADSGLPLVATVTGNNVFQTTTDPATGLYQMYVISDTYTLTAVPNNPDYAPATVTGIVAHNGQTVQQDFQLNRICTVFSDDVESGNIGWTAQSPWAITTEDSHSPTHSWTDSPGGNYANFRNVSLTSPVIDLTDITGVTLSYWQICDTEAGYDYCRVEVSTNGGGSWTQVAIFDGPGSDWEEITLALPMLDNESDGRLRFRFTSDSSVTADGWHVDDVRLYWTGESCTGEVAPEASFTSSSPDALGTATTFTNESTGSDLTFLWDFGDGNSSTAANPTHTYSAAASYTVTLTATNNLGSDVFTATVDILESPQASFDVNSPLLLGETAVFTNTSTGSDLSFTWNFGDGLTSTQPSPSHTYALTGTYTVTLTAVNAVGTSTAVATIEVITISKPPEFDHFLYIPFVVALLEE